MKKVFFLGVLCTFMLTSCGGNSSPEEHDHEAEGAGHNHEHEAESKVDTHTDEIIFTPEQAKSVGLQVEAISPQTFSQVIKTSGQILAAQGDETTVVATVSGVVSFHSSLTEGMSIRKGASLLSISSANLLDGDPVQRARIAYETARQAYERQKSLLNNKIVSEKEFAQTKQVYENARLSYEAVAKNETSGGLFILSPMSGYVKSCLVNEGDYVTVGQPLVGVTQNRKLFLRAEVSETYYRYLKTISSANFKTPYDNQVYQLSDLNARLLSFGKASADNSFYIPVTFEFDNKGDVIPGSFVEVYLLSSPLPDVLAVPHGALTEEQGLFFVYLQLDEEGYQKQEVILGADNGREVQVLSGLKTGDRVVTKGAYQVKLASASSAIPAHSHEH